jgi:hypothetical protein
VTGGSFITTLGQIHSEELAVSLRGSLDDFFTAELEAEARRNWDGNLRPFVPELPACDDVLAELKQILPDFFPDLIDRR